MQKSSISWCDYTWNVVTGCSAISPGCGRCYAKVLAERFWGDRKFEDVQCHEDRLKQPLHLRKPAKIFVNSMSDLFHEKVPNRFIFHVFETMLKANKHTFQILTKRPDRMKSVMDKFIESEPRIEYGHGETMIEFNEDAFCGVEQFPLENVWLGVSVENQKTADERIPILLKTQAKVRFISYEPALEKIDFSHWLGYNISNNFENCIKTVKIDQIIVGCESGAKRRPANIEWFRAVRDQCHKAGIPFFMKQMEVNGKVTEGINLFPKDLQVREYPND